MTAIPSPPPFDEGPAVAHDGDGPVFGEPWEALAFAMAVRAQELGWFAREDFVDYLSREIASAPSPGGAAPVIPAGDKAIELQRSYYARLLAALEKLLIDRGFVAESDLRDRWQRIAEARGHEHRHG